MFGEQAILNLGVSIGLTVLLEVSLGGGDELDGNELEATGLEARDDGANQATLQVIVSLQAQNVLWWEETNLDAIRLDSNEAAFTVNSRPLKLEQKAR